MKKIHALDYDIFIGQGILPNIGSMLSDMITPCRVALITDTNVKPLYEKTVSDALTASGYTVYSFSFPAGEENKTIETVLSIVNFCAEHALCRTDAIVALGGGVVGDMTGFAASMYLRGIPFVQVPTTLLAAVDSSVGGKTGANLPQGKNLIGAFYRPKAVFCDTDTFSSLPQKVFSDGMAEVVKYGMIMDGAFFSKLECNNIELSEMVATSVQHKCTIVKEDEFDRGMRQLLNFGHTFGHAIEKCSNFTIAHGSAVAMGMVIAAKSVSLPDLPRLEKVLTSYHLPTKTPFRADALLTAVVADKKRSGKIYNVILPESIGHCVIKSMSEAELLEHIERGL